MGQAGLTKVYLVIDHPGNKVAAVGIDNIDAFVSRNTAANFLDAITADQHIGVTDFAFIDQACVRNE